ncbi:MAG: TlpA disulfide reductase family protein [Prevotella sp.]|nr:TlpA disulfide reductase family protein [Prevotella sp.]
MNKAKAFLSTVILCCIAPVAAAAGDNDTLPSPTADRFGFATLRLQLVNYTPDMVGKEVTYGQDGAFLAINRMPDKSRIGADGSMTVSFPVAGLTAASIIWPSPWYRATFYMLPGDTTVVRLDMKELLRRKGKTAATDGADDQRSLLVDIKGPLERVAREYCDNCQDVARSVPAAPLKAIAAMNVDSYVAYQRDLRDRRLAAWRSLPLSKATLTLAELDVNMEMLASLNMGAYHIAAARKETNGLVADGSSSFMKDSIDSRIAAMEELKMLNDGRAQLSQYYYGASSACPEDEAEHIMGTSRGPYFDFKRAFAYHLGFSQMKTLDQMGYNDLIGLPSGYRSMIEYENGQMVRGIETARLKKAYHINEIDSMSAPDMFRTIVGRYPGKVQLIDFWGTWCGACLMALKEMEPMKEELKDHDIVYIHICDKKSSTETWQNMVPKLSGEHYRVSVDQWIALQRHAGLPGTTAPAYVVIDRNGNIQRAWTGFGGSESVAEMKRELMKALGK